MKDGLLMALQEIVKNGKTLAERDLSNGNSKAVQYDQ